MSDRPKNRSKRLDLMTVAGLVVALAGLSAGLILEGGEFKDVKQFTAALIVFGGTLGAVLVSTPPANVWAAARRARSVFIAREPAFAETLDRIVQCSVRARRSGIVSLEDEITPLDNEFLRKGIGLAVDGVDTAQIREMLELDLRLLEEAGDRDARVFEQAGGYAPTIGIMGAVMGLMQVMKHLENIAEVGRGIAVAFVATIYGVGVANLVLLPAAAKVRARTSLEAKLSEMVIEGVVCVAEGLNPRLIRIKLDAFLPDGKRAKAGVEDSETAPRTAATSVAEG